MNQINRGYLLESYKIFNLNDRMEVEYQTHYHEFHKVILFVSGSVTYCVEGDWYKLISGDVLLIGVGEVHKPVISNSEAYERIVVWIHRDYLQLHSQLELDLETCFSSSVKMRRRAFRNSGGAGASFNEMVNELAIASDDNKLGHNLLKHSTVLKMMVYINRLMKADVTIDSDVEIVWDEHIRETMEYINNNLEIDLTISLLADRVYLSRHHLMRKFKRQTGDTIHRYIIQKRIQRLDEYVKNGFNITESCYKAGFKDYSNMSRAFVKKHGVSPRKFYGVASSKS